MMVVLLSLFAWALVFGPLLLLCVLPKQEKTDRLTTRREKRSLGSMFS